MQVFLIPLKEVTEIKETEIKDQYSYSEFYDIN